MRSTPLTVRITFFFFWLIAALWACYAGLLIFNLIPSIPTSGWFKWSMVALALGVAGIMIGMVFLLKRHFRPVFYTALCMLVTIAVLSIADQFGWINLFSLVISLAPLVLMIRDRAWYIHQGGE